MHPIYRITNPIAQLLCNTFQFRSPTPQLLCKLTLCWQQKIHEHDVLPYGYPLTLNSWYLKSRKHFYPFLEYSPEQMFTFVVQSSLLLWLFTNTPISSGTNHRSHPTPGFSRSIKTFLFVLKLLSACHERVVPFLVPPCATLCSPHLHSLSRPSRRFLTSPTPKLYP